MEDKVRVTLANARVVEAKAGDLVVVTVRTEYTFPQKQAEKLKAAVREALPEGVRVVVLTGAADVEVDVLRFEGDGK
jgi:CYTH domain-containing protein